MPNKRYRSTFVLALTLMLSIMPVRSMAEVAAYHPVVDDLVLRLDDRPQLKQLLSDAIDVADVDGVDSLEAFYSYTSELMGWVPVEREVVSRLLPLFYIANQASDDGLNKDDEFSKWLKDAVDAYGDFLDSPESAAGIESFASMPNYNLDDYFVSPSGWLTFNQFFAREMRPGKRPIAAPRDDRVIVSPADAVFMGSWPVNTDSTITVKGVNWAISDLLDGSPYQDAFKGGIYTHSFLYIDDYHRYHVPVGGTVKEIRNISGKVYMDVGVDDDGRFTVVDGETYQFNQERGLVIIDSPEVGLVAVLPIGMSYVSSVNLTPEQGATLQKGDEFGFFLFGGSDVVMLFQDHGIKLDAQVGTKYLQGQRLGSIP
ncbi:MAG: phosphatidylserine decarboxylase [Pseudomonadota bacterium]